MAVAADMAEVFRLERYPRPATDYALLPCVAQAVEEADDDDRSDQPDLKTVMRRLRLGQQKRAHQDFSFLLLSDECQRRDSAASTTRARARAPRARHAARALGPRAAAPDHSPLALRDIHPPRMPPRRRRA